jgi:phage minor structural protein
MEIKVLNAAGSVLFVRDDMEQGNWTQEEYTVNATFPYVAGKVLERGQRIAFKDPATNNLETFEIRNVTNTEPEHYQQIIAEHIAVSELSDEHINNQEITDKTPAQALGTVLTGTLWAVGNVSVTTVSSVDISRGSVWQAVGAIASNWNVYITPRVVMNQAGTAITGRYLDVTNTDGVWRGVRLSIDKNMSDSAVVYDDSGVLTALYGYGGTVEKAQSGQDDKKEELTFADVVWRATSSHPAKPAGQTYLEDPAKTALYGRNGRPRYGYYQNADIKDANVLLEKTWDALKETSTPIISITGTVSDLYRLGYHDEPIRLHDIAIVDVSTTGESFYLQIIKCDVDLVDPTATRPEIGAYIPNIIYINREENNKKGGGGGGRGQDNDKFEEVETYTAIEKNDERIALVVGTRNGDQYIKAGQIGLAINKTGEAGSYESTAYINANHVNIGASNSIHALVGSLVYDPTTNSLVFKEPVGGVVVEKTEQGVTAQFGVWDKGNLTGGVMVQQINGQTVEYITADHINISATNTVHTLAGDIEHDANGRLIIKNAGGMYVRKTIAGITSEFGVYDDNNLTGGIVVTKINGQSGTITKIAGTVIDIGGLITAINGQTGTYVKIDADKTDIVGFLEANTVTIGGLTVTNAFECQSIDCENIDCTGIGTNTGDVDCGGSVNTVGLDVSSDASIDGDLTIGGAATVGSGLTVTGDIEGEDGTFDSLSVSGDVECDGLSAATLTVDGDEATWKSQSVITSVGSSTKSLSYLNGDGDASTQTVVISVGHNSTTLNYLGK